MNRLADVGEFAGFGGNGGSMRGLAGALDGFKDRGMELVKASAAATGAVFAWGYLEGMVAGDLGHPVVKPILQGVAGVIGSEFADRYDRDVAMGVGVGLVSASLVRIAGVLAPGLLPAGAKAPIAAGLAAGDDSVFVGTGALGRFLSGAPVSVEESQTLAAAPVSVEEMGMAGVGSFLG
jgi:hypothetical protein